MHSTSNTAVRRGSSSVSLPIAGTETTPPSSDGDATEDDVVRIPLVGSSGQLTTFPEECCNQLKFASAVSLTAMARILSFTTDTAFLGHLGKHELAASGLGNTIFVCYQVLCSAAAMPILTLCGQAWGAGNKPLLGKWLYISAAFGLVSTFIAFPLIFWTTGPIVKLLGMEPQVVDLAQQYNRICTARLPALSLWVILRQFLQSQRIVTPVLWITVASVLANAGLNYLFIFTCGFGFPGSPWATVTTTYVQVGTLALFMYVRFSLWCDCFVPPSRSHFTKARVREYFRLARGLFWSYGFDLWITNAVSLTSSKLGSTAVAAQAIMGSVYNVLWGLNSGFSLAIVTRVTHHLGAGQPAATRQAIKCGFLLCGLLGTSLGAILQGLNEPIASIFTKVPEVKDMYGDTSYLVSLAFVALVFGTAAQGVLQAIGVPAINARVTLVSNAVVLAPLAFGLIYATNMGLEAIWLATACGETVRALASFVFVRRRDLRKDVADAVERAEAKKPVGTVSLVVGSETEEEEEEERDAARRAINLGK